MEDFRVGVPMERSEGTGGEYRARVQNEAAKGICGLLLGNDKIRVWCLSVSRSERNGR